MEIEINGFKCYSKTKFEFPTTGVTLLKGCSGAGKSTILQAITWCLYGGLRGVDRNVGSRKGKLNVTLRLEIGGKKCEIYRQKRPNLLKFRAGILEQVDSVAQSRINDIFGSEEMWRLCCYLEQSQTNPLFRVSSSEKMSLLNKVAFNESDPTPYIRKIEELLKEEKVRFQVLQETFQKECDDFAQFIKLQNIKPEDGKSEEDMECLQDEKRQLEEDLLDLRRRNMNHHQSMSAIDILSEQIITLQGKIAELQDILKIADKIPEYENSIEALQSLKHVINEVVRIETVVKMLQEKCETFGNVEVCTEQVLYDVQNAQQQYSQHVLKAEQCDVEYNSEAIEAKKEFIRCLFKIQPALKLHKNVLAIYEQIAALPTYDIDDTTLKTQEEKVYELKRGSDVLNCPACNQNLVYKSGKLECCDHAPSTKEQLTVALKELECIQDMLKAQKDRKTLLDQFEKLKSMYTEEIGTITPDELKILGDSSSRYLLPDEVESYKTQLFNLHAIKILDPPEQDIKQLKLGVAKLKALEMLHIKERDLADLLQQRQNMEKCCGEYSTDHLPDLQHTVQNYKNAVPLCESLQHSLEKASSLKTEHLSKLDSGLEEQIGIKETRLTELRQVFEKARVTNEAVRRQASLKTQRESIVVASQKVYNLERLKGIAIEVECKVLQQTVDSVNSTINVLAESIFDEPIRVELKLYKQLKTKKIIRPGVNVEIRYKGGVYENPNEISGGEQDRLSLLVTLALNRLSGSPLMMLDETFSSLDEGIKEHCLRAVRSATTGKNVICVDHGGVEGYYDQVINICF